MKVGEYPIKFQARRAGVASPKVCTNIDAVASGNCEGNTFINQYLSK
jgi:hypothetical protein